MRRIYGLAGGLIALVSWASASPAAEPPAYPGFSPGAAAIQRQLEQRLVDSLSVDTVARHFRFLTEEPHPAGSARNLELAEYTRDRFIEYGLEDVELVRYDVLLPLPKTVEVEMVAPTSFTASLREDGYPEDKDSWAPEVGPTFIGMSASGDVTGEVIYAHSGNPADYDWLESQGIDPRGKIAIVRYSMPYSYRGFKAWEAERRGVKALIIYSDPMEDGYRKGEVFPHGPWGPASHIQRGAITYDFIVPGDPLTPGWASVEGARRIASHEARSVPKIVAVPMSWRDAQPILEALGGPVAPSAWQGALPLTYHVGPGPATVRVHVDMDDEVRPIWVVTGAVRGRDEPESTVVLGNHRDAWVYGAVDPSSGSATLLEEARLLGALAKEGLRPRRTVVLASWDAEEWHLTGSTEWGEQFAEKLGRGAVAYLNVDGSVSGPEFSVSGVASLNALVESVAADVLDPNSRQDLRTTFERRQGGGEGAEEPAPGLVDNDLGSGSDYTVFLNFLGVPIIDMAFEGPYGVYHSQYDSHYWMTRFGDPGLRYMTAMAEVWGKMALRLANAELLPYDFSAYATTIGGFLDRIAADDAAGQRLDLTAARAAVERWQAAAGRLAERSSAVLAVNPSGDSLQGVNEALKRVERELLLPDGIPDRPWFKHALYAPRFTYAAMSLPGVTEAVEASDWPRATRQLDALAARLEAAALRIEEAADLLEGIAAGPAAQASESAP
jgi:N-acetylated-alpha-linked acidic dipeptidase